MEPIEMVQDKLRRTVEYGTRALESPAPLDMETLDQKLRTLNHMARELFQETLREIYEALAVKLDRGETLERAERDALELLFVGEAKYYLKTENNYHDWIFELRRLMDELRSTGESGLQRIDDLMHVQALCRDASHVLPEVMFYLRERERVETFQRSLQGEISRDDGRMLARMIRDLMSSPLR
jgi:hypothetical protein